MDVNEPDAEAVAAFWAAFREGCEAGRTAPERPVDVFAFGDSAALADELADLVVAGTKRATAGSVAEHDAAGWSPSVGDLSVAHRGDGTPVAVIRTDEVRTGPLGSVDDAFAWDEGEGDRTRADWLSGHRAYFTRALPAQGLALPDGPGGIDDLPVVFERFSVVWPPEIADAHP